MSDTHAWTNWAGSERAQAARVVRPDTTQGVVEAVRAAVAEGRPVKPVGAGHSFTAAAATEGVRLELDRLASLVRVDSERKLVTVQAGMPLRVLNRVLAEHGLAMPNLGDIDRQTISGAISTGTHGTGARFGGLATQVHALELVMADGSVRRCSADERPDLYAAARVGLGALGVISTVTLRCVPAFVMHAQEYPARLDDVLDGFDELAAREDHVEFHWFLHSDRVMVKRNQRMPSGTEPRPMHPVREFYEYRLMENTAFGLVCRLGRAAPRLVAPLNRLCGALLSERSYQDVSHRVFTTPRHVRFVESEYAVPRECLHDVLRELRAAVSTLPHPVIVPVEVRVAAADDLWLSTAYRRDTAYVAVHQFLGMPYREYFDVFESIARAYGGRPHWGKLHTQHAAVLRESYPRFDDFCRLRAEADPSGLFRNGYLDRVLGPVP
jgi:FAD-linked oxidoreductase